MSDTGPDRVKVDGERHYAVGDSPYPSVTTVTNYYPPKKEALQSWKARTDNFEEVRDRAGVLGTLAHHRILNPYAIRSLPPPEIDLSYVDDELKTDIETCELLWEKCDFPVEDSPLIEKKAWSHEHEYAGTFDMFTDGTVVDLKTSAAVQDSYRMQVAAYFYAMREMPDMPDPDDAAIIVLCPDPDRNPNLVPKVTRLKEPELAEWFDTFTECIERYNNDCSG